MRVEHLKKTPALILVPVDCRLNLFREVSVEDIRLAHHGTDTTHLKHQPLNDQRPPLGIGRQQSPGLLRQVDHQRTRLEDREVVRFAVDDGRNPAVRIDA